MRTAVRSQSIADDTLLNARKSGKARRTTATPTGKGVPAGAPHFHQGGVRGAGLRQG